MATAELKAKISLDNSAFEKGMRAVSRDLAALQSAIGGVAKAAAGIGIALGAISTAALVKGVHETLKLGESLDLLSMRTGASAGELMVLQEAFKLAGVGADQVGPAINRMQKALTGVNDEGEPTNKMFAQLGLNVEALRKMKATEQFEAIGNAIQNLASPAERAAAAMGIFGKSGGALLPAFMETGLMGEAKSAVGGQAAIMDRSAKAFHGVNDALESIRTRFQGLFTGIAEKILPSLKSVAGFIENIDLSGFGQKIGSAMQTGLNVLINAFKQGQLGELFSLSIQIGAMKAVDFTISIFRAAFVTIGEVIGQALAFLKEPTFWSGMVQTFVMAANIMAAGLLSAMAPAIKSIQDGIQTMFEKIELAAIKFRGGLAAIMDDDKEWERINAKQKAFEKGFGMDKTQAASIGGVTVGDMQQNAAAAAKKAGEQFFALSEKGIFSPDAIKKAFSGEIGKGGIFGENISEASEKLRALFEKLNIPISQAVQEKEKEKGKGGLALPESKGFFGGRQVQAASTLERIGAMMGGNFGGQAIALARRTADGIGKLVQLAEKQISANTGGGTMTATYAQ